MSDLLIVPPEFSENGRLLFAKNSDRYPNEAQGFEFIPGQSHGKGSTLKVTHLEIPQVANTFGVLISRPHWTWGAEMGANERGVVVGHGPVYTKERRFKKGLTGGDLTRLCLERAATARGGIDVLIALLSEYGQGGGGDFGRGFKLHSSAFLIGDPNEAWKLETAGKHFVAKKLDQVEVLSTRLTTGEDWDLSSPGLEDYARRKGTIKGGSRLHFADAFSDRLLTKLSGQAIRRELLMDTLETQPGSITPALLMECLRVHESQADDPIWSAFNGGMVSVCMHAGGLVEARQTTASFVWDSGGFGWATGTSAPCLSLFKPIHLSANATSFLGRVPTSTPDDADLFWRNERLHRRVATAGWQRPQKMRPQQRRFENAVFEGDPGVGASAETRDEIAQKKWAEADEIRQSWLKTVSEFGTQTGHLDVYWQKLNQKLDWAP